MKCKNCGADYRTREMACPYCGTPNLLGRMWSVQTSEAEQEYQEASAEAHKGLSIFVLDRVVNRIIVIGLGILILSIIAVIGVGLFFTMKQNLTNKVMNQSNRETMKELFDSGEWEQLYGYMFERDLIDYSQDQEADEEIALWSRAADLAYDYGSFREARLQFMEADEEKRQEEDCYTIESVIRFGHEVLRQIDEEGSDSFGAEHQQMMEDWQSEIRSCMIGMLGMTAAETADLESQEYIWGSYTDSLIETLQERGAWLAAAE